MASVALDPACGVLPDIFVAVGCAHLDVGRGDDGNGIMLGGDLILRYSPVSWKISQAAGGYVGSCRPGTILAT